MKFTNCLKKKLCASSIVEVIVALAICMIIFVIAMSVIVSSQRSNNIRLKQKAQFLLSTVNADSLLSNASFDNGSLRLESVVKDIDTIPGVSRITYSVFDNANHKLGMKEVWLTTDHIHNAELSGNGFDKN